MTSMRIGREAWLLGLMLVAFVAATIFFTRHSEEGAERKRPSARNAGPGGARAYYDLLTLRGLKTRRLERPLTELPPDAGLLVMAEPFKRGLQPAEVKALNDWLLNGGVLLYIAETPEELEAVTGSGFEEASIELSNESQQRVGEVEPRSPYARDVAELSLQGPGRVRIKKPEKVKRLIHSSGTLFGVTWPEKKGRVIYVSSALGLTNDRLSASDNAVFFLNVAQAHAKPPRPVVVFDEYRQGYGSAREVGETFWTALGPGIRSAAWYLLFGFILVLITLNRRFGAVKQLPTVEYRPSTEYVASMAALYQRSGAGIIALEAILRDFARELSARLDTDPAAPPEEVAQAAHQRLGWEPAALAATIRRSHELLAMTAPMTRPIEQEFMQIAQRLREYRAQLKTGAHLDRH